MLRIISVIMKNNNYTFTGAKTYPIELPIYIFFTEWFLIKIYKEQIIEK